MSTEAGKRLHDARHQPEWCSDPCELQEEIAAIEAEAALAQPAPPLDVERLAEAMRAYALLMPRGATTSFRADWRHAEAIAREYATLSEPNRCPFCAEGLPLDATGWHIREPGPDDLEGIQRIPCARGGAA